MEAVTGELPPPGDGWAAEVKWDGQRLVAAVGDPGQPLRLDTTRGHDAAERFPELNGLPSALAPHRLILDGEVVAFGEHGRPDFGLPPPTRTDQPARGDEIGAPNRRSRSLARRHEGIR
jgi:bifunctional non-homologous end joining protein LigD